MEVSWSHSALKEFENCARRYHETRVLRKHKMVKTEKMLYGDRLHKAAEQYVKGKELPEEFVFLKGVIDALLTKGDSAQAEVKMALKKDLSACDWFDKETWVRGIADLLILDGPVAWVVDYKTGNSKYPDRDQLALMSAMVMVLYPQVQQVNSALLYVTSDTLFKHKMIREELDDVWWKYRERVARIEAAHANKVWNPTSTPLCPWCPVTTCEFHPDN
jgi:PD-(D/E)XK nuclease superfamily